MCDGVSWFVGTDGHQQALWPLTWVGRVPHDPGGGNGADGGRGGTRHQDGEDEELHMPAKRGMEDGGRISALPINKRGGRMWRT